jgi:hypothetical protein
MMLVADEGVDQSIVDALRTSGHSVKYFAQGQDQVAATRTSLPAANEEPEPLAHL